MRNDHHDPSRSDVIAAFGFSTITQSVVFMKAAILAAVWSISAAAVGAEPPESLTHYGCYTCHSDREAITGPAFAHVAAAYRGRNDAEAAIAKDIRAGMRSGGPWHMPPHPEISVREARRMARYIMSLAPERAETLGIKPLQ